MAHFKLIGIVMSLAFLTGCGGKQTYSRQTIEFEPRLVNQRKWSVDKKSFVMARVIQILPPRYIDFCEGSDRDYYDFFDQSCDSLMASLFGRSEVSTGEDSPPIVLHTEIVKANSKVPLTAFSDADFAITIRFRLTEHAPSGEKIVAEIVAEGQHSSGFGTMYGWCEKADKRACLAIEKAFLAAQDKLYAQLMK